MPQTYHDSSKVDFALLAGMFHLSIKEVSAQLGICATVLKKVCRRNGISRWPYRKIKSINNMLENLNSSLEQNPSERSKILADIEELQEKKNQIMTPPHSQLTNENRYHPYCAYQSGSSQLKSEDSYQQNWEYYTDSSERTVNSSFVPCEIPVLPDPHQSLNNRIMKRETESFQQYYFSEVYRSCASPESCGRPSADFLDQVPPSEVKQGTNVPIFNKNYSDTPVSFLDFSNKLSVAKEQYISVVPGESKVEMIEQFKLPSIHSVLQPLVSTCLSSPPKIDPFKLPKWFEEEKNFLSAKQKSASSILAD